MFKHIKHVTQNNREHLVFVLWLEIEVNGFKGTPGKPAS
jgi:hypothetical protein